MVRVRRAAQLGHAQLLNMRADTYTFRPCAHTTQEANYGHQQELDMIPLMIQKDYSPKGWLGLILGTRLWYAMHSVLSFHCCCSALFVSD